MFDSIKNWLSQHDENYRIKLNRYDIIQVSGKDAAEFLHNQFTSDVKGLAADLSSLSAWCSIKGRVLYTFRLWHDKHIFYIQIPSAQTESFLKRLQMFILRADVHIERTHLNVYGLFGEPFPEIAKVLPTTDNHVIAEKNTFLIRLPSPVTKNRFILITHEKSTHLIVGNENDKHYTHWKLLDILTGIPEVLPQTADRFLPQMLDLERLGGLSFKKGCYPGQEIVARVKYRGELKKKLYKGITKSNQQLEPGESLITLDDGKEFPAGNILNLVLIEDNLYPMLAVINIEASSGHALFVKSDREALFEILSN